MANSVIVVFCPACDKEFTTTIKEPEAANNAVFEHLQKAHPEYPGVDDWIPEEESSNR